MTDGPGTTATVAPQKCPSCSSTSTTSIDKPPDANSYWRCLQCGDVWNPGRLQVRRTTWQRP